MEQSWSMFQLGASFFKINVTAATIAAHVRNKVSNVISASFNEGITPVEVIARDLRATQKWRDVRAGKIKPGLERDKWEALMTSRELEADMISADTRAVKMAPASDDSALRALQETKVGKGMRKVRAFEREAWKLGDSSSKLGMASRDFDLMRSYIRKLRVGEYVDVGSYNNRIRVKCVAQGEYSVNGAGKMREGAELYRKLVDPAMERASRTYVNYNEVGLLFEASKKWPAVGLFAPFMIYGWKSLSLGSKGMLRTMMSPGEGLLGATNSASVALEQSKFAAKQAVARLGLSSTLHQYQDKEFSILRKAWSGFRRQSIATLVSKHQNPMMSWVMPMHGTHAASQAVTGIRAAFAVRAMAAQAMAGKDLEFASSGGGVAEVRRHRRLQRLVGRLHAGDILTSNDMTSVVLMGRHLGTNAGEMIAEVWSGEKSPSSAAYPLAKVILGGDIAAVGKSLHELKEHGGKKEAIGAIARAAAGFGWTSAVRSRQEKAYLAALKKGFVKALGKGMGNQVFKDIEAEFRQASKALTR